MEHEKTHDKQIHASVAKRIEIILKQYKGPYEVTLCLSLLQTLLTQCLERQNSTKSPAFEIWLNQEWTLGTVERSDQQKSPLRRKNMLESLRHALSHPCDQNDTPNPATGYSEDWTDSPSQPREIQAVKFTHSPWIKQDGSGLDNRFARKQKPYKVLQLVLNTEQLRTLTLDLSQHLSSPLNPPPAQ